MEDALTPAFIMIEDEIKDAQRYVRKSHINELIPEVSYVTEFDKINEIAGNNLKLKVFWVDINLGEGREDDGIDIIRSIREEYANAFIIAHTAYADRKTKSLDAGADIFILKQGGAGYDENMALIKRKISEYLNKNGYRIKITEYDAEVAHIDDNMVKLECRYEGNVQTRFFHIEPIEAALGDDLLVDARLKIRIIEKGPEIRIVFERDYENMFHPRSLPLNEELLNSDIWDNKISKD